MKSWKDIQWIFEYDKDLMMSLRDIYVKGITISDWKRIIDLLNREYKLTFGSNERRISIEYVKRMFADKNGELPHQSAIIDIKGVIVNCHFFTKEEIEFDLFAKDIISDLEFSVVIDFMRAISGELGKEVILCDENDAQCPIIKIDIIHNVETILSKEEALIQWKHHYGNKNY